METGKISGLGPDIDGGNEVEVNSAPNQISLNVKPKLSDAKTQKIVDDIYSGQKKKTKIGNGTMMDAVRNEIKTGKPTEGKFHSVKAKNTIKQLDSYINSGRLNEDEKTSVRVIRDDLKKALAGH